ncbi:MAG: PAS domain-containing sensor histidine kinase [Gemmatimonadaceae bacterium]
MTQAISRDPSSIFVGETEMAQRCRAFDWAATALGPIDQWPSSLRTTVSTMLASRHPMFLWWGPELVQIFNDGYLPSFGTTGRDRAALGARGRDHWAEIWPIIGPQIEKVMTNAEATWHEDQLVPIERNGRIDDVWWTYGYSPVRNDDGNVGGVLAVVQETTARVLAEADRDRLLAAERSALAMAETLQAEADAALGRMSELFRQAPAFIAVVRGPEFIFELANDAYYQLVGHRDIIGKPVFDALPDARGQGFEDLLRGVLETGRPAVGRESPLTLQRVPGAAPEERYLNFVYSPLIDPDGATSGVFVHGVDVTDHVRVRTQAEAARDRLARLQALSVALSTTRTVDDVAAAVLDHATVALDATDTLLARISADEQALEIVAARGLSSEIQSRWDRVPLSADVPLAECARTIAPLFLETRADWAARYPALMPFVEAAGHHANMIAPLVGGGRLLGVLGAAFNAPHTFHADDRALLLTVAEQCGQALERSRLFEAECAARAEAETANRAKSEFLAVMSHELRTPLNAIGGYAEIMEMGLHGPVTPQQREDLARVQRSQRHLLGLVNQVLDYTRIDRGSVHYDVTDVPVGKALAVAEALIAPQLRSHELGFDMGSVEPTLTVRADIDKLQQILLNLLTNAIKFTDARGHIRIGCTQTDGWVTISVSDTGIGIAAEKLATIFEPFVQVHRQISRAHEGVGLGLAISRDLARGMGGDLAANSTPGEGSRFTLTLPSR